MTFIRTRDWDCVKQAGRLAVAQLQYGKNLLKTANADLDDFISYTGDPPCVGWFHTPTTEEPHIWRWWNGKHWSVAIGEKESINVVSFLATFPEADPDIHWTNYWPKNARVPRNFK